MSKAGRRALDARVLTGLRAAQLTDLAVIDGEEVEGYFHDDVLEVEGVSGRTIWFDCSADDVPTDYGEGDEIELLEYGQFNVIRVDLAEGRALIVLGTKL